MTSNAVNKSVRIPTKPIILNFLLRVLKAVVVKTMIKRMTAVLEEIKKIVVIIKNTINKEALLSFVVLDLNMFSRQKIVDMTQKNPR